MPNTNIEQFFGSGSTGLLRKYGEETDIVTPNYFSPAPNVIELVEDGELLDFSKPFWKLDLSIEDVTKSMYKASKKIFLSEDSTMPDSFVGVIANELHLGGYTLSVTPTGRSFSGIYGANPQEMLLTFPIQLRGGNATSSGPVSSGKNWRSGGTYRGSSYGGGAIIIVLDKIVGKGVLSATGAYTTYYNSRGGGGMILIFVKEWSGQVSLDITGDQNGSYAIFKRNADDTETLMVHSMNGVSAPLNGQTPTHGADASIAW